MDAQIRQRAEKALEKFFGSDRLEVAVGIFFCLHAGDALPKQEFAGVKVEDVRAAVEVLGFESVTAAR